MMIVRTWSAAVTREGGGGGGDDAERWWAAAPVLAYAFGDAWILYVSSGPRCDYKRAKWR